MSRLDQRCAEAAAAVTTRLACPASTWPIAADAHTPGLAAHLHNCAELLLSPEPAGAAIGLLEGSAGLALTLGTAAGTSPVSCWDTCLLLN